MNHATGTYPMWRIFRVPLAIALLSAVGLVAALTGDGWLDVLSWSTLTVPPLVALWAIMR